MATAQELIRMAQAAPYSPPIDYRTAPLGSAEGEDALKVPYNTAADAVVYVRNWSALRPRKVLVEGISPSRGGGRAVSDKTSPYFGKTVDELHRIAKDEERDMSWYKMQIAPIMFGLRFDNQVIPITHELEDVDVKYVDEATGETKIKLEKQPRWVLIPPGAWDHYMGNYQRINSKNHLERTREMEQRSSRGLHKWVISDENEFGLLEFRREEVRYETQRLDRSKLSSDQIIEV